MGRNMASIADEVGEEVGRLTPSIVKEKMKYFRVPENQTWRVSLLGELMDESKLIPGFTDSEISTIKNYLCTS